MSSFADQTELVVLPKAGTGNRLPIWLLALCGAFTAVATAVSVMSITLQLKNYRKPALQRAVVRIMVMVPLYAISSLIALFSLEAAFFIDAIRDLYEAFVIYTFLQLLITYLGGERSLLIILHGRPPIPHPFPVNIFLRPMDVSDPWTLLNLKRGVLQYVQIKPLLVVATVILKATGTYREGRFAADSGYTYISVVYNTSICLSLYCLAMFWVAVSKDLKPFRPLPKFLCVKGILFFSFWQSIGISLLASTGVIKHIGPYTDAEHMSLALVDSLICFEMPLFAIAHQYAFQASDYIDHSLQYAARLPFLYAFRDAFGFKDVWEDTKDTIRGRGISYQAYEPAEGSLHHDIGRQKRIRAGLRYSKGGAAKYWIPIPGDDARHRGETGPFTSIKRRVDARLSAREGYAPLLPKQLHQVIGEDPDAPNDHEEHNGLFDSASSESDAPTLGFESLEEEEDTLYERARRIGYAGFPNVDVSKEERRKRQWEEEDGILAGKWNRNGNGGRSRGDSGAVTPQDGPQTKGKGNGKGKDKDKGKKAVYGAWADRSSSGSRKATNGHAGPSTSAQEEDEDDSRQYDGDVERNDARKDSGHQDESDNTQMRWTKRQFRKGKSIIKTHLEIPDSVMKGNNGDSSPNSRSRAGSGSGSGSRSPMKSPLPPDAVDLVVEDQSALEEAQTRERRRGEPQTKAPTHIYRHNNPAHPDSPGVEIEEVYSADMVDGDKIRSDAVPDGEQPNVNPEEMLRRIEETAGGKTPWQTGPARYEDEHNPWSS